LTLPFVARKEIDELETILTEIERVVDIPIMREARTLSGDRGRRSTSTR
jgi:hypothetical protein